MNADDWEKIKELFAQVLEQPAERRAVFLRGACADDGEHLRAEVESLLAAHDETERHLIEKKDYAAALAFDGDDGAQHAGKQFGNYRIIREIGRGGMGAVFLAERTDGEFEQRAALKIIRQTFADRELENRFRRERQILASLNHPNIARLLDGGVSALGEPFLLMEYVAGENVLEYAEKRNLDTEQRLELFLKICRAVGYAHRNLVVHRDIKPSNILVGEDGEPKLLDFGLAKILDESRHENPPTATAFRAFTPAYASPEQMQGKIVTTASDVYSLGVVLYELLTGAKPFRFEYKTYEEILRFIETMEPPRPSSVVGSGFRVADPGSENATSKNNEPATTDERQINPKFKIQNPKSLEGDLDNIVLMALSKEPERRYGSVEELARDIERHLNNLPVIARPQTFSYRAAKFFRRNRWAVSSIVVIITGLAAGLGAALWQADAARVERDRAERRFNDVRRLSNALLTEIAPRIEKMPGATEAREALVTQSLKYLDALAQETGDDALQLELAAAYEKVGDLQGNPTNPSRNALHEALASYEKANVIRRRLLEKNPPDFEQRRLLANNYRLLGVMRWQTKETDESQKNIETAVKIYSELLGEQPDSFDLQMALAQLHLNVGKNLYDSEKYPEAIEYFQKTIDAAETLRRAHPDRTEAAVLLANAHQQIGSAFSWNGQQAEGEAAMARAIGIYEPLVAANPNDVSLRSGLWQTYWMTSGVYEEQNDRLANEYDLKALKIVEETVAKDQANLRAKEQLARTYAHLGVTFENIGQSERSIFYLEKAVAMLEEISANEQKNSRMKENVATALIGLGDARHERKDFANARRDFERAVAILDELTALDAANNSSLKILANAHSSLAKTQQKLSAPEAAKANYRRAQEILLFLDAKNSLSEYDRKFLERIKTALQKLENN